MSASKAPSETGESGVTLALSRRGALTGGGAAGLVLLSSVARGQGAPLIRKFGRARWAKDVDNAVDSMSSLLEPLIMAILGVLVGSLVIAMYLPIFKLGAVV